MSFYVPPLLESLNARDRILKRKLGAFFQKVNNFLYYRGLGAGFFSGFKNIKQSSKCEKYYFKNVGGSVKRYLANPNSIFLESCNLIYEFGTALKLGPNIPPAQHYC